ncbi:MAG TPA: DNA polymerase III subunit delta [Actinomycetota bacterium]
MSRTNAKSSPVSLLWGEDEFLLREAALELLGDLQPVEVDGGLWQGGETADLATPSLFGERRALLVSNARALPDEGVRELARYLEAPDPGAPLVLVAVVGDRAKAPAALVKLVKGVGAVTEVKMQRKELPGWLLKRATAKGLDLAPDGAAALVDTLGEDPGALERALEQLATAFSGERITREIVARQFRGLGEQHVWDLCDRAFSRDLPGAMRSLRTLLEAGEAGLMLLGAITSRLRDLIRVASLPERLAPADAARQAGLRFDWQVRRYRQQAKRFSAEDLAGLHERIAWADRALKSGATDDVVLPMLVAAIAGEPAALPV